MAIKQVTGYQTSDGEFFGDAKAAQAHQRMLDFATWYSNNGFYVLERGDICVAELSEWLVTNREEILEFLGAK